MDMCMSVKHTFSPTSSGISQLIKACLFFLVASGQSMEPSADWPPLKHPLTSLATKSWPNSGRGVMPVANQWQSVQRHIFCQYMGRKYAQYSAKKNVPLGHFICLVFYVPVVSRISPSELLYMQEHIGQH